MDSPFPQDDFTDYNVSEELEEIKLNIIDQAVLSGTDWTTETIVSQINKGNIILDPKFQRRDAWDVSKKSSFIESLFLGLPIPQLVLAESKQKKGSYIVIDGKQRLLTLRQFISKKNDNLFKSLKLNKLSIRRDLNGKTYESISNDLTLIDDLSNFENQAIRTVVIRNWKNENLLYSIFLRLNTGSVPLAPQELRQALHPGSFINFIDDKCDESIALKEILKNDKPDFRMRDAELLVRYYGYKYFINQYSGNLKTFLDYTCNELNKNWSKDEKQILSDSENFEDAFKAVKEVFGRENVFRKWTGNSYQNNFNRAIFDIMMFYFSVPSFRNELVDKKDQVVESFKNLCLSNDVFISSIERTTKSIDSNFRRFNFWSSEINKIIKKRVPEPKLIDNRIIFS